MLRRLLTQPSQSVTISEVETGNNTLRVLTPISYTRDCLACHGGPAGEWTFPDIAKKEPRRAIWLVRLVCQFLWTP